MSSAAPTKWISKKKKKKKKRNIADVTQVNATRKKLGILGSADDSRPSQTASVDKEPPQSMSHPPPQLPSNFNQLLPKQKKFESINKSNIIIGIRTLPDKPKDMLPSIQKQVLHNFETSYVIQQKQTRLLQSTAATSKSTISITNDSTIPNSNNSTNAFHLNASMYRRF